MLIRQEVCCSFSTGKRFVDDTKVTDMLYSCYDIAAKGKDFDNEFQAIRIDITIISDLGLDLSLEENLKLSRTVYR